MSRRRAPLDVLALILIATMWLSSPGEARAEVTGSSCCQCASCSDAVPRLCAPEPELIQSQCQALGCTLVKCTIGASCGVGDFADCAGSNPAPALHWPALLLVAASVFGLGVRRLRSAFK